MTVRRLSVLPSGSKRFVAALAGTLLAVTATPAAARENPPTDVLASIFDATDQARISGDGDHVAYRTDAGGIELLRVSDATTWTVAAEGTSPALSDDGDVVVYESAGGQIVRWQRSDESSSDLTDGRAAGRTPEVSDDGSVVVWQEDDGTVVAWDAIDGIVTTAGVVGDVVLSGDGTTAFAADGSGPFRWDLASDTVTAIPHGVTASSDDASTLLGPEGPSGLTLQVPGEDPWQPLFDNPVERALLSGDADWTLIAVDDDGRFLNGVAFVNRGDVELYRLRTPWLLEVTWTLDGAVPLDVSDDGEDLLLRTVNGLEVWDVATPIPPFDPTRPTAAEVAAPQLSDQLVRLYRAYFDREPDAGGLAFWMAQRANGMPLTTVSQAFAGSPEFVDTYAAGLTDTEFVTLVYANVLDREPDAGGLAAWTEQLGLGMTRGRLMVGFSESPEFIESTGTSAPIDPLIARIGRYYEVFYGRPLDDSASSWYHVAEIRGFDLDWIAAVLWGATESEARWGGLDDEAFVELVYERVFGREPDAAGRAAWLDALTNGLERRTMLAAFADSPEFIVATDSIPPGG